MAVDDALKLRVARQIARVRAEAGLTQEAFATALGIAVKNVQRLESGRQNLTLDTMARVTALFGIDVLDLLRAPPAPARVRSVSAAAWTDGLVEAGVELVDADATGAVPVVTLRAIAGTLGEGQRVEARAWARLPGRRAPAPSGTFLARVLGASMEPRIPDGSWCEFATPVTTAPVDRVVLLEVRDVGDDDARYVVKRLERADGKPPRWRLASLNRNYEPIVVDRTRVRALAELVRVLRPRH